MIGGNVTEFDKITPETYEKMNEEFEEEGLAFRINVPTQEQIDEWRQVDVETLGDIVTKTNIAKNLVTKIEELLDGKAHYIECSDRTTYHKKIVIEYDHEKK